MADDSILSLDNVGKAPRDEEIDLASLNEAHSHGGMNPPDWMPRSFLLIAA